MTLFQSLLLAAAWAIALWALERGRRLGVELERVEGNLDTLWRQVNDLHPTPLEHPRSTTRRDAL